MLVTTSRGGGRRPTATSAAAAARRRSRRKRPFRRLSRSQAGKRSGWIGPEQRQVVAKVVEVVDVRPDDDQRAGRMAHERGRHQRAARAPDSAQRGRMASLQAGDHLGEAALRFQTSDQIVQSIGRGKDRLRLSSCFVWEF